MSFKKGFGLILIAAAMGAALFSWAGLAQEEVVSTEVTGNTAKVDFFLQGKRAKLLYENLTDARQEKPDASGLKRKGSNITCIFVTDPDARDENGKHVPADSLVRYECDFSVNVNSAGVLSAGPIP